MVYVYMSVGDLVRRPQHVQHDLVEHSAHVLNIGAAEQIREHINSADG